MEYGSVLSVSLYIEAMSKVHAPVSNKVHELIDALLPDRPLQTRISEARHRMKEIEARRLELSAGIFEELSGIMHWLTISSCAEADNELTSDELEEELSSKLLPVYIDMSGGALIF